MNGSVMRFLVGVGLVLSGGVASAQPFSALPGKWWERPRVAAQLNLTPDQVARLNEATYPHARAMIDLKASVEKATLDLQAAADTVPFDADKTRMAFNVLLQARQRLETQRFEMLLKVRGILGPEQWRLLQTLARERREENAAENEPTPGAGLRRLQPRRRD